MDVEMIHDRTAANRRRAADFFDGLAEYQLQARSLCPAWTVSEVLGHLVMPLAAGLGDFLWQVVRTRGSVNRASEAIAIALARRPVGELTALLRSKADQHGKAPGVGPMGQMADGCLHLRDCARPLGLADDVSLDDWKMVLDWLPSASRDWFRSGAWPGCAWSRPIRTGRGVADSPSPDRARHWPWPLRAARSRWTTFSARLSTFSAKD